MLMSEYRPELREAAQKYKGIEMPLAGFKVSKTFSFNGDRSCAGGSKVTASVAIGDGLLNVSGLVPLSNTTELIVAGELDDYERMLVRTFFPSELWCGVIETVPERATVAFYPDFAGKGFSFVLTYKHANETVQLTGVLTATDSLVLAFNMARGVGFNVDLRRYAGLMQKAVEYDKSKEGKKVA